MESASTTAAGTATTRTSSQQPPTSVVVATISIGAALVIAALVDGGPEFKPRVPTLDALAGLAIGAFLVDRVLTFVPPGVIARKTPQERAADLSALRFGYGALLGALFVGLTDLRAVAALTGDTTAIEPSVDRGIAVLAIAGGVVGLARLLSGINPQPDTDATKEEKTAETVPPPEAGARIVGFICLAIAIGLAVALTAAADKHGVELLGQDEQADGTVALVVRFGVVIVAAAIVEQLVDVLVARFSTKRNKAVLTGAAAVIAGVLAARVLDLYLLHNIGFFGVTAQTKIDDALAGSTDVRLWGDTLLTGIAIAAGTKPLHDLASRLRKAKEEKT